MLCHFADYILHIHGQCQASEGLLTVANIDHGSIRSNSYSSVGLVDNGAGVRGSSIELSDGVRCA